MPIDINQNDGRVQIVAVGGETELDFDFPLFEKSHLRIIETDTNGNDVDLVLDTDYTIATDQLEVELGGVAVLTAGQYPSGAPAGYTYTLLLNVPEERTTDFNQAGDFFAATLNRELDLITQQNQQLRRDVNSAIRVPASSSITDLEIDTVTANAALVFNATADGLTSGPTTTEISNAQTYATNASASATAAAASAVSAAASAASLVGTSTTSMLIGTGSKVFTTQSGKYFGEGTWLLITSDADEANYMHGQVTAYSGTSLTVNVTNVGGSGTLADWTIRVSGTRGATGATGATGTLEAIAANSILANATGSSAVPSALSVAASRIVGRAASGNIADLSLGAGLAFSGTSIVASRNRAYDEETANTTATGAAAVIPIDTSTPLSTEGVEILSVSITPSSNTARLRATVYALAHGNGGAGTTTAITLFAGSTFLNGGLDTVSTSRIQHNLFATVEWVPGSTSPVTVSARFGPNSAGLTSYLNAVQTITTGFWGSAQKAVLIVEEL